MTHNLTSIVIISYNSRQHIDECLRSLETASDAPIEIIVVDNASSDGSAEYIAAHFPAVRVIANADNAGYAQGINQAAQHARGEYLVVFNMDIVVRRGWLFPLTTFLNEHPEVGAVNPCILLYTDRAKINALGQNVHVTGLGFNRKLHFPVEACDPEPARVSGLQGGAFAMKTEIFRQLGGMNEAYFLYHEDVEFSLRLALAGYQMYTVPQSEVYHKYALHMTPEKLHWLERHRWMTVFSTYHSFTLILLMPMLLLTELMMLAYCLLKGFKYLQAKYQALGWVIANRALVQQSRRKMQSVRHISDWRLVRQLKWLYNWDQFFVLVRQSMLKRAMPKEMPEQIS